MPQLPGYLEEGNEYQVPKPETIDGFDFMKEVTGFAGAARAAVELGAAPLVDAIALGGQDVPDLPRLTPAEIQERQKADGVTFAVPSQGMTEFEVNYWTQKARTVQDAEKRAEKASGATRLVGGIVGGIVDPTIFMPIPGLNQTANKLLLKTANIASRTGRVVARTAIRAGEGAIEGAAGAVVMTPVVAEGQAQLGREYGLEQFATDVGMGAAGGAVLRAGIVNPIQEALWRRQGKNIYAEIAKEARVAPKEGEQGALIAPPEERRTGAQAFQEAAAADAPTVDRIDVRDAAAYAADDWQKAWTNGLAPEERARFVGPDGRISESGMLAVRDAAAKRVIGEANLSRLVDLGDDASDALIEGTAMASTRIDASPVARQTVEAIADTLARSREEGIPVSRLTDVDERVRTMTTEVQRLGDAPQSIAAVLGRFGDLARGMETADEAGDAFLDAIATAWNDASAGAKIERLGPEGSEAITQAMIEGMVNDRSVDLRAQVDASVGVASTDQARAEAIRNASPESRPFSAADAEIESRSDEWQAKAAKEPETPDEARRQADDEVTRADKDLADLEEEIKRAKETRGKASQKPGMLPETGAITREQVVESVRTTLGDAGAKWIEDGRADVMTLEELRKIDPLAKSNTVGADIQMPDGTRKIVLVSDRLGGMDAGRTLLHEIFHFQRESVLGESGWSNLRAQVQKNMRSVLDAEARGEILTGDLQKWREARNMVPSETGERMRAAQRAELIEEETVAYLIESAPESRFVKGIIAKVRAWLFQQGFRIQLTEDDIRALAVSMMRRPVEMRGRAGTRYSVAPLPERIDIDGVSRPTKNSAGRPLAQDEEGVRNFWRWFGDSKVVDEAGNPLVVYHGTNDKFNKINFKKGNARLFWFTSDPATIASGESGARGTSNIMALYAKIENPADWKQYQNLTISEYRGRGIDGAILKSGDGFNGFIFADAAQIKSATGNRGTFDPSNPDIRYSHRVTPTTLREGLRDAVDKLDRAEKTWPTALQQLKEFTAKSFDADDEYAAGLERMAIDRMMATDKTVTAEDATALLSAWLSTGGDAEKAAEQLLMAQAAIVRRNAIGARKTARNFRDIVSAWKPEEIAEGLISLDDASMMLRTRSRDGAAQRQKGFEVQYKGYLARKLGDLQEYAAGRLPSGRKMTDAERRARDLEIFTALREGFLPGGPNPSNLSDASLRVADAIRQTFNLMRRRGHDLGEIQGELEDWGLTQAHDRQKLQNAAATLTGDKRAGTVVRAALARLRGKFAKLGSAENFEAWAAFSVPHLDLDRMGIRVDPNLPLSQWTKKARRALESIYEGAAGLKQRAEEFGVVERNEVPGEIDDPRGVLEAFEGMQARRIIHFKDAESAFAYNEIFGPRDLFGGVTAIIEKNARSHGMRYIYGASPEAARGRLIQMLREHAGMEGRASGFSKISAWKMRVVHDEVTGRLSDPVNSVASRALANARAYSGASKLAGTAVTQLMDAIPASISNAFRFRGNAFGGSLQMLGRLVARFDGKERTAALDNLLVGHDSEVGEILRDQRGDVGGATARLYDFTMKIGGVNYLDRTNIRTIAMRVAHGFAEAASNPSTMPQTERLLAAYGIEGADDLRVIREASTIVGGRPFLSPENVANVSREALDAYATKRGLMPDEAADDLELTIQTLISSEIQMARMAPTLRTRAITKFGTRPGTFVGDAVRAAGQFKSYPAEYARRLWVEWPDALGGKNLLDMPWSGKFRMAGYMATMIAGGLMVQQIKALILGKMPLPLLEGDQDDRAFKFADVPLVNDQTLIRAITQAGVIPIYMDQILGPDATEPSKAVAEAVLGPTVGGAFTTAMSALNAVKSFDPEAQDFDKAVSTVNADLVRAAKGWTPFVGHWATKAAMDRLIWWQLQEMASPGWAEKFERRSEMKGGLPYIGMRPQFEIAGERIEPELPEWFGRTFTATPTEATW
ncbi:MAG TPA: hypothetical protein PKO15_18190 [Fibrobacteria bacterium]|nr:hypothetical protein [Fibrobacteria bacterium]